MSVFVKICGLTDAMAVAAAIDAGADAIGLVFAPSVRQVTIEQAVLLAGLARGHARIVAVMRHPEPAFAAEVQARVVPDIVQTDAADFERIGLLDGIDGLPVYRDRQVGETDALAQRLLFEGQTSGSGKMANWSLAATLAAHRQLILAGGLDAGCVGDAIAAVRPFGVDVSSGVEREPGIKDANMMVAFVDAARAAHAALQPRSVVE